MCGTLKFSRSITKDPKLVTAAETKVDELSLSFFQTVSNEILKSDVEDFGDLMLDVAEAFMAQQEFLEAIKFLENLIASENWAKVGFTAGHRCWTVCCCFAVTSNTKPSQTFRCHGCNPRFTEIPIMKF